MRRTLVGCPEALGAFRDADQALSGHVGDVLVALDARPWVPELDLIDGKYALGYATLPTASAHHLPWLSYGHSASKYRTTSPHAPEEHAGSLVMKRRRRRRVWRSSQDCVTVGLRQSRLKSTAILEGGCKC